MTPKQLAPHWKFVRRGQLWYDWPADVVRRITRVFPGGFLAYDESLRATYTWRPTQAHDDAVVAGWCLLT